MKICLNAVLALSLLSPAWASYASVAAGHIFVCKTLSFDLKNVRLNCEGEKSGSELNTPREWLGSEDKDLKVNRMVKFALSDEQLNRWLEINHDAAKKGER